MAEENTTERIRSLNDQLRCRRHDGRVVITRGIEALGPVALQRVLDAVAGFDSFTGDNDPYGEHDSAVLDVDGRRIIWKIDYYDTTLAWASPNPSDPEQTRRIMTVMLAEDY